MDFINLLVPVSALILFFFLVYPIRKIAIKFGLVDKPNHRKVHAKPIPLVGGLTIFFTITIVFIFVNFFNINVEFYKSILPACTVLLIMGVADDRFDLRAILKLAIQLLMAHYIFSTGIRIESFHGLFGIFAIADWQQYLLTILIIVGVVNAFNLMDGIDGLAGGLAVLGFGVYAVLAFIISEFELMLIFLTIIASLISFLRFNLKTKNKIFMGDAGSLLIGFILVVSAIKLIQLSQNSTNITLIATGTIAVLVIPVLDSLRVYRKRIKSGKSPFAADKTHLHHLIIITGLKHKYASLFIILFMLLIIVVGYLTFEVKGINIAIIVMLLVFHFVTKVLQFQNRINFWKEKIKSIEFKK